MNNLIIIVIVLLVLLLLITQQKEDNFRNTSSYRSYRRKYFPTIYPWFDYRISRYDWKHPTNSYIFYPIHNYYPKKPFTPYYY